MNIYTRIVRKGKNNVRIELPNKNTILIPIEELSNWLCTNPDLVIGCESIEDTSNGKSIVGIDPSYTRTGIAVLTTDKRIIFHTLSEQIGKKDFPHTYNSAHSLAIQLKDYLSQFEPYDVVMEYAPPVSSMSPALYCLDALYHFVLHDHIKHLYHPMTLATIIGKRDRTKADSVLKGLSIIEELKNQGWQVDQK